MQHSGSDKEEALYFYTHSCGSYLTEVLKNALKRRQRWDDETYLARIIFCEMLKMDDGDLNGEIGFGISTYLTDNQHDLLVVNCETQMIGYAKNPDDITKLTRKKSFENFIK